MMLLVTIQPHLRARASSHHATLCELFGATLRHNLGFCFTFSPMAQRHNLGAMSKSTNVNKPNADCKVQMIVTVDIVKGCESVILRALKVSEIIPCYFI